MPPVGFAQGSFGYPVSNNPIVSNRFAGNFNSNNALEDLPENGFFGGYDNGFSYQNGMAYSYQPNYSQNQDYFSYGFQPNYAQNQNYYGYPPSYNQGPRNSFLASGGFGTYGTGQVYTPSRLTNRPITNNYDYYNNFALSPDELADGYFFGAGGELAPNSFTNVAII